MAAPFKTGLDYFSHDSDMSDDFKIKLLASKYGVHGYGLFNKLLEDGYKEHGYYFNCTEDNFILIANYLKIEEEKINEIINFMVAKGLFNKELYLQYSILTSERMQKNFIKGVEGRQKITMVAEYILINIEEQKTNKAKWKLELITTDQPDATMQIDADVKKKMQIPSNAVKSEINGVKSGINLIKNGFNSQKDIDKDNNKKINNNIYPQPQNANALVLQKINQSKDLELKFNLFWEEYPKKKDRKKAHNAFLMIKPGKDLFDKIMHALGKHKLYEWIDTEEQYIPLPESWLKGERWNDEIKLQSKTNFPPRQNPGLSPETLEFEKIFKEIKRKELEQEQKTEKNRGFNEVNG
jgi:hypothetical protein